VHVRKIGISSWFSPRLAALKSGIVAIGGAPDLAASDCMCSIPLKTRQKGYQMDSLISQFFAAIQNWSEQTAFPEDDLRLYLLDRVGPRVDWSDVEMELATVQTRVEELVHRVGISEKFLIVALIQAITRSSCCN